MQYLIFDSGCQCLLLGKLGPFMLNIITAIFFSDFHHLYLMLSLSPVCF